MAAREKIPTREECFQVFSRFKTPNNVIAHCLAVNSVALFLSKKLNEKGEKVSMELVDAASLLHDFARPVDFQTVRDLESLPEEQQGGEERFWHNTYKKYFPKNRKLHVHHNVAKYILSHEYGYHEVAELIRHHKFFALINEDMDSWEKKIIYYADMRVNHDGIVALAERFEYFDEQYGKHNTKYTDAKVRKIKRLNFELEKKIFDTIGLDPAKLKEFVDKDGVC